tara:strand:+ start:662 stop:799 length:138 start_codon:yes stop_codon:yes gene_type:complete
VGPPEFSKLVTKLTTTLNVKKITTALLVVKKLPVDFKGNISIRKT